VRERRSDPQTREPCSSSDLAPNRALYGEIAEWVERRRKRRQRLTEKGADVRYAMCGTWLHWVHQQLALPYDWRQVSWLICATAANATWSPRDGPFRTKGAISCIRSGVWSSRDMRWAHEGESEAWKGELFALRFISPR